MEQENNQSIEQAPSLVEEIENGAARTALKLGMISIALFVLVILLALLTVVLPRIEAVTSLFGLAAGFVGLILLPAAVVYGCIGIVKAMKIKEGLYRSIAGFAIGSSGILLFVFYIIPSLEEARLLARRAMIPTSLNGIYKGIMLYQDANDDEFPNSLELLIEEGYGSEKMLKHTYSKQPPPKVVNGKFKGEVGYVIFLDFPEKSPGNTIVGYGKTKYAFKGRVYVLLYNGSTKEMTVEELNKQLKAENRPPAE